MFGSLGWPEIVFILILALLVFGPKRLPEVGRTLGRGLREFRRATSELKRTVNTEISTLESMADPEPKAPTTAGVVQPSPPAPEEEASPPAAEQPAD